MTVFYITGTSHDKFWGAKAQFSKQNYVATVLNADLMKQNVFDSKAL